MPKTQLPKAQLPKKQPPQPAPIGPPAVDMMASGEVQNWLRRLQAENRKVGRRNKVLWWALGAGVLLLVAALWIVHHWTIGAYAVIDRIEISQHPANQGRLRIKFQVLSPGKVYCRRTSGPVEADLIDSFDQPCTVDRPWSWTYTPGHEIDLTLWYRGGPVRRSFKQSFPTADRADIVILMDTTGSMSPYINELKAKCAAFSEKLNKKALKHRFALIGFGDAEQRPWIDTHPPTENLNAFVRSVGEVKRFDGGDLPESALDALEEALKLPFDEGALRRFYLVSDATYHAPARSGATAEEIAARLEAANVMLCVFSEAEFEADYAKLLGETGRFREIENFGKVLSEGRVLED